MIILDFETNSANVHDVIEVAAFKVVKEDALYVVKDTFHRYYFSAYEVNPHALAVHQLSPDRLECLRRDVDYEEYFEEGKPITLDQLRHFFQDRGEWFFNGDEFPNETNIDTWGKTQESVPLYQAFKKENEDE